MSAKFKGSGAFAEGLLTARTQVDSHNFNPLIHYTGAPGCTVCTHMTVWSETAPTPILGSYHYSSRPKMSLWLSGNQGVGCGSSFCGKKQQRNNTLLRTDFTFVQGVCNFSYQRVYVTENPTCGHTMTSRLKGQRKAFDTSDSFINSKSLLECKDLIFCCSGKHPIRRYHHLVLWFFTKRSNEMQQHMTQSIIIHDPCISFKAKQNVMSVERHSLKYLKEHAWVVHVLNN